MADLTATRETQALVPTWDHELELCARDYAAVAGVDEAGRGAWAGPLVAAAVVLPHPDTLSSGEQDLKTIAEIARLRDSKMLSPSVREELLQTVQAVAVAVGVGAVSSGLIDVIGIGPANRLAWARAVRDLGLQPDYLLLDAFKFPWMQVPQRAIIKGDATCMSIAAASVVAKVARDHMMQAYEEQYPGYGFSLHKGYGTRFHANAIERLGVTGIHRKCFAPIQQALAGGPVTSLHEQCD